MAVNRIGTDGEALERGTALSEVGAEKETEGAVVDLALRRRTGQQRERAARTGRHFERARAWGAVEDAGFLHRAEKNSR